MGGVCTDASTAQDCSDTLGLFFDQQYCADVEPCDTSLLVDAGGTDDPGAGLFTTIQGAIDYSHDGMTIEIMPGNYLGTGDSVITLPEHGITMTGIGGAENTIINAQSQRRGLIGDGCGDNGTVIQGLTFTNGYADNGGGILLNDCSVELRDCIIIANNATDNGGGIDACGAGIVIESCSFSENNCTNHGGAIHSNCGIDLLITNCDFTLNTTDDEVGGGGGIALLGSSTADVSDCTFTNNQAAVCGGVYLRDASVTTWTDCQFNQNHASWRTGAFGMTSDSAEEGCVTTLTRCVFTQNSTSAHVPSTFFNGDFETTLIDDCTFTDNGSPGPCLRNSGGTLLTIRDTLMCSNSGGNIDENYDPYTDDGGNTIRTNCDPWIVDDLYDDDPNADFDTIQEAVDAASDGDEILVMPGTYTSTSPQSVVILRSQQLTIRGTVDENNEPLTIVDGQDARHCLFSHNGSNTGTIIEHIAFTNGNSGQAGGAVQLHNVNSMSFNNCIFSNSHASGTELEGNGGGMYCLEATVSLTDCTFTGNLAANSAGALWIDGSDMMLVNTEFLDNVAIRPGGGSDGGGMLLSGRGSNASAILENCTFENNSADFGGGISADPYAWGHSLLLDLSNCTFRSNHAGVKGGGVRTINAETAINECSFCGNTAPVGPHIEGSYTGEGNTFAETCPPLGACCVGDCDATSICYDDLYDFECSELGGDFHDGQTCGNAGCGAVQWSVEDGGNGHWYQRFEVTPEAGLSWTAANDLATAAGGYLATITSVEEDDWVIANHVRNNYKTWLGGFQPEGTGEPDQGWQWITNEEWNYTNWTPGGEPNNSGGEEDFLQYNDTLPPTWNDALIDNTVYDFIIEWSADCNDDGIVDYGQILDGTLSDVNCDGIPDSLPVLGRLLHRRQLHQRPG